MVLHSNSMLGLVFLLVTLGPYATEAQFQFDSSTYTVRESMASVIVCVQRDIVDQDFSVFISTINGTAEAISDYIPISDFHLVGDHNQQCILIAITDDEIPEPEEHFGVLLRQMGPTIISNATVYITDDDNGTIPTVFTTCTTPSTKTEFSMIPTTATSMTQTTAIPGPTSTPVTFSFSDEVYSTVESDGSVEICTEASSMSSGSIIATIAFIDSQENTATRNMDFVIPADGYDLRFGNGRNLTQCGMIEIIDDEQPELTETFTIALHTMMGTGDDPASNAAATAVVSIVDDDYPVCAEDAYLIFIGNSTELTVCVIPVLCVQTPEGSQLDDSCVNVTVTNEVGTTIDHRVEVLIEEVDGRTIVKCVNITFFSLYQSGRLHIFFDSSNTTCTVNVIAPTKVPPSTNSPSVSQEAIIGSAVGGALVLVLSVLVVILATLLCCRKCVHGSSKKSPANGNYFANPSYQSNTNLSECDYEEIHSLQRAMPRAGDLPVKMAGEKKQQDNEGTGMELKEGGSTINTNEAHLLEEGYIYDNEDFITAESNVAYGAYRGRIGV